MKKWTFLKTKKWLSGRGNRVYIKPLLFCVNALYKYMQRTRPFVIKLYGKKAFLFYIPKVANKSLKKKYPGDQIPLPFFYKLRYKHYLTFALVRNPYDRIVSCYSNKIENRDELTHDFKRFRQFSPHMSFREFVRAISNIPDNEADRHFKSQYWFLYDRRGNPRAKYVIKLEEAGQELRKVDEILGISPRTLPHENRSVRDRSYTLYYDDETRALIEKRYRKDIEVFEYSFNE